MSDVGTELPMVALAFGAVGAAATAVDVFNPLPVTGAVALSTASLDNGGAALTPKFAIIAEAGSGDNAVVALVAAKKIRVLAFTLMAAGAVNAKWRSNDTDISGLSYFAAAGAGLVAPFNPLGWFETAAGEALDLNLSAAVAVGGSLVYVEV